MIPFYIWDFSATSNSYKEQAGAVPTLRKLTRLRKGVVKSWEQESLDWKAWQDLKKHPQEGKTLASINSLFEKCPHEKKVKSSLLKVKWVQLFFFLSPIRFWIMHLHQQRQRSFKDTVSKLGEFRHLLGWLLRLSLPCVPDILFTYLYFIFLNLSSPLRNRQPLSLAAQAWQ